MFRRRPIILNPQSDPPVMDQSRHHRLVLGVPGRQRYVLECTLPARREHVDHRATLPDGTVVEWVSAADESTV